MTAHAEDEHGHDEARRHRRPKRPQVLPDSHLNSPQDRSQQERRREHGKTSAQAAATPETPQGSATRNAAGKKMPQARLKTTSRRTFPTAKEHRRHEGRKCSAPAQSGRATAAARRCRSTLSGTENLHRVRRRDQQSHGAGKITRGDPVRHAQEHLRHSPRSHARLREQREQQAGSRPARACSTTVWRGSSPS